MPPLPWKPLSLAWLAILVLAFGNGALRALWLNAALGPPYAQWLSGSLLIAAILLVTRLFAGHFAPCTPAQRWTIGAIWLALTMCFEFGMGLAQGQSLPQMLAPYRFTDGNLWPLVLAVTVSAPALVAGARR